LNNPNKYNANTDGQHKPSGSPRGFIYPTYQAAKTISNRYQAVKEHTRKTIPLIKKTRPVPSYPSISTGGFPTSTRTRDLLPVIEVGDDYLLIKPLREPPNHVAPYPCFPSYLRADPYTKESAVVGEGGPNSVQTRVT
jgi:hypothetical protein